MMSGTILITGIEGFTGSYAKTAFESRGYEVLGLSINESSDASIYQCDLRDVARTSEVIRRTNPTGVIHLAGISSPTHDNLDEFYSCNTVATTNLLDVLEAQTNNLTKVIIASSSNVYGSQAGSLSESNPFQPVGHYANSKVAMELMARNYFSRLPLLISRPFNYTGVGQTNKFVVPKIVEHFRSREEKIELGNINVERDFLDVRDVSEAYVQMFMSDTVGTEMNICSGRAVSLNYIIETLSTLSEHEIAIKVNPDFVRPNDIPLIVGESKKLTESTNFRVHHPIEDTLAWMLEA